MMVWSPVCARRDHYVLERCLQIALYAPVQPFLPAMSSCNTGTPLESSGASSVDFRIYPGMQHSSCPEEMSDFAAFLKRVVPDAPPSL